jgi:poly-gamma-glutamate biosynthesis protein PgsC/CapC
MIVNSVGIGLVVSLVFTEITGFCTGGIISPGYLALFIDQPLRLLITILVSLVTYGAVLALSRVSFLFGRRRFALAVLIGYLVGTATQFLPLEALPGEQDLRVIGYIIPGLIANDMIRQGVVQTLLSLISVAVFVRLLLFAVVY